MSFCGNSTSNWKREPWFWVMLAIPSSAVIMGIVMLTLAVQSWSGLVVDDYYQQGKRINRVLARDRMAWKLDLAADLSLDTKGGVEIRFQTAIPPLTADQLTLELIHATRPGLDRKLVLHRVDPRVFRGQTGLSGQGRWNLFLQTTDWRLTGSLYYPGRSQADLLPNYFGS